MCLLIFAHHASPKFPLIVAANRDEFHARPTAESHFWASHPNLLAGQDLEQGGTWMGITRSGRFAAVTNFRDPDRTTPAPKSRGELPLNFLASDESPENYLSHLANHSQDYAGFNLLVGTGKELWYYDNSVNQQPQRLLPGIYGLSNANLDTPWPKVVAGKQRLQTLLAGDMFGHDELAQVVTDRTLANPASLNMANGEEGSENSMEHLLSAQFIVTEAYGTRSTTSLWVDDSGDAYWREQSFKSNGELRATSEETLTQSGY
jgi:uncharacterized protein with NRDE domain